MSLLFKNYSLLKFIYLLIRCSKTRFFLWNTNITDLNGVNKQNAHTHTHTPNTKVKRVRYYENKWYPLILKQPHLFYTSLHFYAKNLNPLFWKFQKLDPLPLYKGGGEGFATMLSFFKLRKWHSLTKK